MPTHETSCPQPCAFPVCEAMRLTLGAAFQREDEEAATRGESPVTYSPQLIQHAQELCDLCPLFNFAAAQLDLPKAS